MSSFHPSTSTSSFTNKSNGRPFLIRADSLPSPPPSRPQKLGPRPSFDATSVPSPQSDVEMPDSTNDILFLSTQAAIDVESSPTTSRQAARMNNEVKIRRKTTPPPPPKGWHSPNNPFIVRDDAPRRPVTKPKKPEKMTYVFRGKRITYDVSFDALVAPDDPEESPFPDPSPRLLFPPAPITPPASTSTSFLDRLLSTSEDGAVQKVNEINYGLPTPAREKDRKKDGRGVGKARGARQDDGRYEPYRRLAGRDDEDSH